MSRKSVRTRPSLCETLEDFRRGFWLSRVAELWKELKSKFRVNLNKELYAVRGLRRGARCLPGYVRVSKNGTTNCMQ